MCNKSAHWRTNMYVIVGMPNSSRPIASCVIGTGIARTKAVLAIVGA
jgi:hypothetical protein